MVTVIRGTHDAHRRARGRGAPDGEDPENVEREGNIGFPGVGRLARGLLALVCPQGFRQGDVLPESPTGPRF